MIKRIIAVAFFTGLSQIVSLLTIRYVLNNLGEEASGYIGIVDSTVLIIAVIASFGIQLSVNRNVAQRKSWRSNYHVAQSARFALSIFVVLFGVFSYLFNWDPTKLIYFAAPLIALNGDYALYGNGFPVHAARLSLLRVGLPNLGVYVTTKYFGFEVLPLYIILVAMGILMVGLISSGINQVPYLFKPMTSFHRVYMKYYKVGIFQLSFVLLITGILTVAKGFYSLVTIGLVFGVLKYFEVFKGVLRIIVQAFFKEISQTGVNFKIDKVGIILGGFAVIPTIIYYNATLELIYKNIYEGIELILPLFGLAMFIASFKTSADVRLLMLRKDNRNLAGYLSALILTISVVIIISYTFFAIYGIAIGILIGEMVLLIILGYSLNKFEFFKERFLFFVTIIPVLLVVIILRFSLGESIPLLLTSCFLYISYTLIFYRKLIFSRVSQ